MKLTTGKISAVLMFFGGWLILFFYFLLLRTPFLKIEPTALDILKHLAYASGFLLMFSGIFPSKVRAGWIVFVAGIVFSLFIACFGYFLEHDQWILAGLFAILGILIAGSLMKVSPRLNS